MIAVDEEYASDETPISAASRIALIPPVSGGTEAVRSMLVQTMGHPGDDQQR